MAENKSILDLLEQSEDKLFRQIIDRQEGRLGLAETERLGKPGDTELDRWREKVDQLPEQASAPAPRQTRWKRAVMIAAIIAAVLAVSVLACQTDLLNFVETVQEQFTQLSPGNTPEDIVSGWTGAYRPEYVPDGYLMSDAVDNGDTKAIEYADSAGVRFTFYQSTGDTNLRIDTEAAELSDCRVGTIIGRLARKDGRSTLFWSTTEASFSIEYDACRTTDHEIQQLAESVTKINQ